MKNLEIVGIVNAYIAQKGKGDGVKLPAAVAWKRRVNLDKLFRAKALIDEAVKEIHQKYADDDHSEATEEGGRKVKEEYMAEFFQEREDILAQETPVEIVKVKIEDLGDVSLTDADMDTIAFMIEE